jgi:hypothetical protein
MEFFIRHDAMISGRHYSIDALEHERTSEGYSFAARARCHD